MIRLFLVLTLVLGIAGCQPQNKNALNYERTVDGDTFIASGKRIRLWGVDAPEKNEPVAVASTKYLEVLLEGGELTCSFKHKDRYKRDVMQCFTDGHDVAADMVKMGMTKDYPRYSKGYYASEEKTAKLQKLGIWSGEKL